MPLTKEEFQEKLQEAQFEQTPFKSQQVDDEDIKYAKQWLDYLSDDLAKLEHRYFLVSNEINVQEPISEIQNRISSVIVLPPQKQLNKKADYTNFIACLGEARKRYERLFAMQSNLNAAWVLSQRSEIFELGETTAILVKNYEDLIDEMDAVLYPEKTDLGSDVMQSGVVEIKSLSVTHNMDAVLKQIDD